MNLECGPLRSISIPPNWSQEFSYCRGSRTKFTQANLSQTSIVILHENRGMSEGSRKVYLSLLERKGNTGLPQQLNSNEIRSLREILGSSTIGDNQHSRKDLPSVTHTPAFNLSSAQLVELNGMMALEIKGAFVDNRSVAINFTRALMVLCKDGRVLKVFMQTPSQNEFIVNARLFSELISSIKWNF